MGYLNNVVVTVDAILTKKGRELLARNDGSFQITQFGMADDEVDYTLYNPDHPSGSAFYGQAIENMPLLEAFPDETQIMKYRLVTLPRGTSKLPVVVVGKGASNAISIKQNESYVINPQTLNYLGAVSTFEPSGYVVTVGDARLLSTFTGIGIDVNNLGISDLSTTTGTAISKTAIGTSFTIVGTGIDTLFGSTATQLSTTIVIVGRDSGARISVPLTVTKNK
jgi:hypothetical protein